MDEIKKTVRELLFKLESELIDNEVILPNSELSSLFFDFKNALEQYCEESGIDSAMLESARKCFSEIAELTRGPFTKYPTKESYHGVMWDIHRMVGEWCPSSDQMIFDWRSPPPKRSTDTPPEHDGDDTINIFTMDGAEHTSVETGCCQQFGKSCQCGGWMHYQPVYGGYYFECERCHTQDI